MGGDQVEFGPWERTSAARGIYTVKLHSALAVQGVVSGMVVGGVGRVDALAPAQPGVGSTVTNCSSLSLAQR